MLKLHCSCMLADVFLLRYSLQNCVSWSTYFFVLFFERILFHWQNVFLGPNHLTNACVSVQILLICLVAELLLLFWVVWLWCSMVKKGLRMKCVMLFPKHNIRNKINTLKNLCVYLGIIMLLLPPSIRRNILVTISLKFLFRLMWIFWSCGIGVLLLLNINGSKIFGITLKCKCTINRFGTSVCLSLWP